VYLATEEDGSKKAVKVIAKEQLKSTKNKSKVGPGCCCSSLASSELILTGSCSCLERSRSTRR
jgi:hypothetical protein